MAYQRGQAMPARPSRQIAPSLKTGYGPPSSFQLVKILILMSWCVFSSSPTSMGYAPRMTLSCDVFQSGGAVMLRSNRLTGSPIAISPTVYGAADDPLPSAVRSTTLPLSRMILRNPLLGSAVAEGFRPRG